MTTPDRPSDERLREVAERHRLYARDPDVPRGPDDPAWCICDEPWPCDAMSLLAEVERLLATDKALRNANAASTTRLRGERDLARADASRLFAAIRKAEPLADRDPVFGPALEAHRSVLAALPSPDARDRLAALGEAVERLVEHLSPRTQFVIELEHTDFGWHVSVRDFGNRVILPSVRDTRPTLPDAVAAALDEPTGAAQEERE